MYSEQDVPSSIDYKDQSLTLEEIQQRHLPLHAVPVDDCEVPSPNGAGKAHHEFLPTPTSAGQNNYEFVQAFPIMPDNRIEPSRPDPSVFAGDSPSNTDATQTGATTGFSLPTGSADTNPNEPLSPKSQKSKCSRTCVFAVAAAILLVLAAAISAVVVSSGKGGSNSSSNGIEEPGASSTTLPTPAPTMNPVSSVATASPTNTVFGSESTPSPNTTEASFTETSSPLFWRPLGQKLYGQEGESFGNAVALSGNGRVMAVGSEGYGNNGRAQVFKYDDNKEVWIQMGNDLIGEASGDNFGYSTALSFDGLTVTVGSRWNDGNGGSAGHVRVYTYNGERWTQLGPDIDGEAAGDRFGWTSDMSSDGRTLAVGAWGNDAGGDMAGHVRVLTYNAQSNTWDPLGQDLDGLRDLDQFGWTVGLSDGGRTVAAGSPWNSNNGEDAGYVRVYTYNAGTSRWVQLGSDLIGSAANEGFGASVSLSSDGSILAVGSPYTDQKPGYATVFSFDSDTNSWKQIGQPMSGQAAGDFFGWKVSLSSDGRRLATGAHGYETNAPGAGRIRVFSLDPVSFVWTQIGENIDGEKEKDWYGRELAMSSDGKTIAVGASPNNLVAVFSSQS